MEFSFTDEKGRGWWVKIKVGQSCKFDDPRDFSFIMITTEI